jgi:hypothetical protein
VVEPGFKLKANSGIYEINRSSVIPKKKVQGEKRSNEYPLNISLKVATRTIRKVLLVKGKFQWFESE